MATGIDPRWRFTYLFPMGKAITIIVGAAMASIYSYSVAPQVVEMLNNANAILASVANR